MPFKILLTLNIQNQFTDVRTHSRMLQFYILSKLCQHHKYTTSFFLHLLLVRENFQQPNRRI